MAVVRSIFAYDRSGWRPIGALLRAAGLALAAYGGSHCGGLGAAVLSAIGALYAGIASFGGIHKTRLRRMLAATGAASLTTFVGCLVQPSTLATVLAVTLGAFVLAILADAGPDAAQVSLLATGLLVVFSGLTGANAQPLGNALLVLGGGATQAAILMLVHPISPVAAERRAVETVYGGLAHFARERSLGRAEAPLPNVANHAAARDLLREGIRYGAGAELAKLWSELELADALRGNLAGLDRKEVRRETWSALAAWFGDAAEGVGSGKFLDRRLPTFDSSPDSAPWLRRICRTVEARESGHLPAVAPSAQPWLRTVLNVQAFRALALGHALRYAVALGVATAAYRIPALDHGYWAPLSLAFSLKPDFAGTVTKGVGRIVGTLAGVALATAFLAGFHPSPIVMAGALLLATWVAFGLLNAWFVGYSAALAFWVVDAVTLAGASAGKVGVERIEATVAGSLFALAVSLLWPRWEAAKARTALAVAFAAQAEYADAVGAFKSPDAVVAARLRSRAARLEAERVVAAAGFEPFWSRRRYLDGASAALARLSENAARVLAAHVAALDPHEGEVPDDLRPLADEDRSVAADLMG